jgi:hypothetical protein
VAERRKLPGDPFLVAHRNIPWILNARWTAQPAIEARLERALGPTSAVPDT